MKLGAHSGKKCGIRVQLISNWTDTICRSEGEKSVKEKFSI
jgi:hypothetical protein